MKLNRIFNIIIIFDVSLTKYTVISFLDLKNAFKLL